MLIQLILLIHNMGSLLQGYFQYAKEKGGIILRTKLAENTGITTNTAMTLPDSDDNIEKIKKALQKLLPDETIPDFGEFKNY